jgi:WD40 repeat protein
MQFDQVIQNPSHETFGRYQQIKRIGRGGMGEVWLCEDALLHRQVAIKTLPLHSQQDQEYEVRFEREAQAAAALNHAHILPVHDYGRQPLSHGQLMSYLVMPYIGGGSLSDLIKKLASKGQGIEQDKALLFLSQAADAIDYAHAQGMVHRDIKPANMLLRADDWLLLSDFGVVRIVSSNDDFTEKGLLVGTPVYMAPEQARGRAEAASDTYSLAVIAYQLVVGRPPFNAETGYGTIMQHILLPPPSPRQFHPGLPPACEEVLLRGLAKQPAERYPSARTFVDELKRSLGIVVAEPLQTTVPQTGKKRHTARRRAVLIGGVGAGLAALGAGTGVWALTANRGAGTSTKPAARAEAPAMVLRDHLAPVTALTWVPNKNVLTSTANGDLLGRDQTLKLWDIDAFRYRQQPEYESTKSIKLKGNGYYLAWSPDGQYLAVANSHSDVFDLDNSFIDIYQSDLNQPVSGFEQGITVPTIRPSALNWLQNRFPIAIWNGNHSEEGDVYHLGMWDVTQPAQNPQPLSTQGMLGFLEASSSFKGSSGLPVAPDGRQVAIGTAKEGVLLGTLAIVDNKVVWMPSRSPLPIRNTIQYGSADFLIWGSGGRRLIGIIGELVLDTIVGWDFASQSDDLLRFGIPPEASEFTALATHPRATSNMFAAGTKDGKIYLWSGETRKLPVRTLASPDINATVLTLSWSPDGQWLAASYEDTDATILIWKI